MPVSSSGLNRNFQGCISIELSRNFLVFCALSSDSLLKISQRFFKVNNFFKKISGNFQRIQNPRFSGVLRALTQCSLSPRRSFLRPWDYSSYTDVFPVCPKQADLLSVSVHMRAPHQTMLLYYLRTYR